MGKGKNEGKVFVLCLPCIAVGLVIAACIMIPQTISDYNVRKAQEDWDVTTCTVLPDRNLTCDQCVNTPSGCKCDVPWDDFTSKECHRISRINKVVVTSPAWSGERIATICGPAHDHGCNDDHGSEAEFLALIRSNSTTKSNKQIPCWYGDQQDDVALLQCGTEEGDYNAAIIGWSVTLAVTCPCSIVLWACLCFYVTDGAPPGGDCLEGCCDALGDCCTLQCRIVRDCCNACSTCCRSGTPVAHNDGQHATLHTPIGGGAADVRYDTLDAQGPPAAF